ncbi:hypothetical protein THRCLA_02011 [Thraustotheca clavata]|uniref:EF-hand domain-containing protein n=1 Tax=Thraustotheca clavata TaxID=74557 RepID=A0A1W0A6J9_9STRA|nr:hypothetical protein THRCLA_02011 [Thraustotheca clavata]
MEADRKPLEWRPYVVLLLANATKEDKTFLDRLQTVLSGALTPRERGVFKVLLRSELGTFKDNVAEGLASSFCNHVERDRLEYEKSNASKQRMKMTNVEINSSRPSSRQLGLLDSARASSARGQYNSMNHQAVDPVAVVPTEGVDDDMLSAAQLTLEQDSRQGSPSHIYVLIDYPSSVAETKVLLSYKAQAGDSVKGMALTTLIDGVVSMVFPPPQSQRLATHRPSTIAPLIEEIKIPVQENKPNNKAAPSKGKPDHEVVAVPVAVAPPPTVEPVVELPEEPKLHKDLVAAATIGGLEWTDFSFSILHCGDINGEIKPIATLTKELKQTLTDLAVDKGKFKAWLGNVKVITVPQEKAGNALDHLQQMYNEILEPIYESSVGIAGILFAMKEAIVRVNSKDRRVPPSTFTKNLALPPFLDHGDVAAVRVAKVLDIFAKKHDSLRSGEPRLLLGKCIDEIEKDIWSQNDLPGVGFQGRKGMPMVPTRTIVERGVQNTELMQFHSLSMADVHYTRKLLEFEAMLGLKWEGKLRFRQYLENLPKNVLPQRLAAILGQNVVLEKKYYAPDDSLLVAGNIITPQGRKCSSTWSAADFVRHRPPFKDWQMENLLPQEYLTPRTVHALGACVSLSNGELSAVSEITTRFYPSDHAVIYVFESPHSPNWLTVHKDWHVFGLRPCSTEDKDGFPVNFHATFEDGSHLTIARGYGRTILVTMTMVSGLVLTISSDGSIQQEYANKTSHTACPNAHEKRRVIMGKGTIICTRRDGSRTIMYANGHVGHQKSSNEPFWTIDEGGSPYSVFKTIQSPPAPVPITIEVDPETKAVVAHRGDGVVTITHVNGCYLTQHADGTQIYGNPTSSHLIVKKEGFAEVSIDVDVNLTAQRHAKGMKIAVTKGGIRTRSIVRLIDGTTIEIDYDTRVIATVHGIIRIRKPDGTIVIAQDNGLVEFRPRTLATMDIKKVSRDDEEEPDTSSGAYYFDCVKGRLQLNDQEHNYFDLSIGTGKEKPIVNIGLAGEMSSGDSAKYNIETVNAKAVVNDPLQPFLFILNGDGTGIEILRPEDVEDYLQQASRDTRVEKIPCFPIDNSRESKVHIYAHSLGCFEHPPELFADSKTRQSILNAVKIPTRASALLLGQLHNSVPPRPLAVTVVRRLKQITPFDQDEFRTMINALAAWEAWVGNREATKDQYAVIDPRDEETRAQAHAMEKKIAAAYKATRARKKAERLKNREKERLAKLNLTLEASEVNHEPTTAMSTLKEVENEEDEEEEDEDEDAHGMESDDSDADSRYDLDLNVDDEYELVLCAFSSADSDGFGRLNPIQTRRALVHALGFGVSQYEVNDAIETYSDDNSVTFEVFARILTAMKEQFNEEKDRRSSLPFKHP